MDGSGKPGGAVNIGGQVTFRSTRTVTLPGDRAQAGAEHDESVEVRGFAPAFRSRATVPMAAADVALDPWRILPADVLSLIVDPVL